MLTVYQMNKQLSSNTRRHILSCIPRTGKLEFCWNVCTPHMQGSRLPCNAWFPSTMQVCLPEWHRSQYSHFSGFTHRLPNLATSSVTIGHISYMHAMWPDIAGENFVSDWRLYSVTLMIWLLVEMHSLTIGYSFELHCQQCTPCCNFILFLWMSRVT